MTERTYLNPAFKSIWHGGDYNPEQWSQAVWDEDVRLMQVAHCDVATIGMFAWARMEPEEGRYDLGWLDDVIEKLTNANRWFILGTPSAAPPVWLSRKYPETLRTGEDGVRRLHGNRVNYNLGSTVYRQKCELIARELAVRYGSHPRLLAWHLSNEYAGADYSAESVSMFREWLRRKFRGDINRLNHAYWTAFWGHTYSDWSEIDPPGAPYGDTSMQGLTVDWQRFVSDQTLDFMLNEVSPLRIISPQVPVTTNLMGTYPGLDYRKFAPHVDFISWDSYPGFNQRMDDPETWVATSFKHDLMRSLKPDRPWLLMEFTPSSANWYQYMSLKRPGAHRFESLHAVAHGADGVQYFQWRQSRGAQEQLHGGVVGHAGDEDTRTFNDVREVGIELESLQDVVGSVVKADVAIVFDWESRWALDAACGPVQGSKRYEETCIEHYRAFWSAGISVDLIGQDDDLSRYKLVVAPMAYSLRPGFAASIEKFVAAGGTFVTTYLTGWVDENSLVFERGFLSPLSKVLGITSEEIDALPPDALNHIEIGNGNLIGLQATFEARDFFELIHCHTANVLASYKSDFYAGRPALTMNSFGKGHAYYVASRNERSFQVAFLPLVAKLAGVIPTLEADLPEGVTAQLRTAGGQQYLFLLNTNTYEVTISDKKWGEVRLGPWDAKMIYGQTCSSTPETQESMAHR